MHLIISWSAWVFLFLQFSASQSQDTPCEAYPCLDGDNHSQCEQSIVDITCEGDSGETETGRMERLDEIFIADIPKNTRDLSITLSASRDIDLRLLDENLDCLAGYDCLNGYDGTQTIRDMSIYFSGDDVTPPVSETIRIEHVTEPLTLLVKSYDTGEGTVEYEWSSIDPCVELLETHRTCVCEQGYFYEEDYGCREFNACESNPCQNEGTQFECVDLPPPAGNNQAGRRCDCLNGWSGSDCMVSPTSPPGGSEVPHGYAHYTEACVSGSNIIKYEDLSVLECANLCNDNSQCLGFGYGVEYGAVDEYKARDCQLQSSADFQDCVGSEYNLDFYLNLNRRPYPSVTIIDAGFSASTVDEIRSVCTQIRQQPVSLQDAGHIEYLKNQLLLQKGEDYFTSGGTPLGFMYNNDHIVYDLNDPSRDLSSIFADAMTLGYITYNEADPSHDGDQPWAGFGFKGPTEIHDWPDNENIKAVICEKMDDFAPQEEHCPNGYVHTLGGVLKNSHCTDSLSTDGYCILSQDDAKAFCDTNNCLVVSQTSNQGWRDTYGDAVGIGTISTEVNTNEEWKSCVKDIEEVVTMQMEFSAMTPEEYERFKDAIVKIIADVANVDESAVEITMVERRARRVLSTETSTIEVTINTDDPEAVVDSLSSTDYETWAQYFAEALEELGENGISLESIANPVIEIDDSTTEGTYTCGTTIEECEAAYLSAQTPAIVDMEPTATLESCEDADGYWVADSLNGVSGYDAETMRVCQSNGQYAVEMDGVVYPTCVEYATPNTACVDDSLICPDRNANPGVAGYAGNVRAALNVAFTRADFGHPSCPTSTCRTMDELADAGTYWKDTLLNNPYTDLTEAQADSLCVNEDNQVQVVTAAGRYNTCVGWSSVASDSCDSGKFLCAGHNGQGMFTYGWPGQISRTVAVAAANAAGNYMHPQCPLMICSE